MLPKPEVDNTKYLLSPMPGALISVDVEIGQEVQPGQALAKVVRSMVRQVHLLMIMSVKRYVTRWRN